MNVSRLVPVLAFAVALPAAAAFAEPRVVTLNPRVHVLLGPTEHANAANGGYMINATVIVGDRGVILVDSGGSRDVGLHLLGAVRKLTDKPVTHVVNTHHHGDHYLGNGAFPGAVIIGSAAGRKLVEETGGEWLALMARDIGDPLAGTVPIAAAKTYPPGRTEATLNGVKMVFWVPRGSHTDSDLMVLLPDHRILVAGDVLVDGIVPTLQDGHLANWIRTLDEIAAADVAHYVPGHGGIMKREGVLALRASLDGFLAGIRKGYRLGLAETEIRGTLDLSNWERLGRAYVIGRNINRAWLEVEAQSFDE